MASINHLDYLLNDLADLRTALTEALAAQDATLTHEQRAVAYEALADLRETIDAHNPDLVVLEAATAAVLTLLAESWSGEMLTVEDTPGPKDETDFYFNYGREPGDMA